MKTEEFDFHLPQERIAQHPLNERDRSKLLTLQRETGSIKHHTFLDIVDYLEQGDTLVLNDTKVIPARLFGRKKDTGGKVEVLLVKELDSDKNRWLAMTKPAKKLKIGTEIIFHDERLYGIVTDIKEEGLRVISFHVPGEESFHEVLERLGKMPLPPYITEKLDDSGRYQTIYSKHIGSVAAPTAGLHFTNRVFDALRKKGVNIVYITLHVGLGTFKPVEADEIKDHTMHEEFYTVSDEVAKIINDTKAKGKRVIAVGTTSCRTIESMMRDHGKIREGSGWTDIFIYPGYRFKGIDGLITNFHLPKSTLIMLVSALAGRENVLNAYQEAIDRCYRFYSFGDAMFIYP